MVEGRKTPKLCCVVQYQAVLAAASETAQSQVSVESACSVPRPIFLCDCRLQQRGMLFARVRVEAEDQRPDLDRATAGFDVEFGRERQAWVLEGLDLRQEPPRIQADGVPSRRRHDRYAGLVRVPHDVAGRRPELQRHPTIESRSRRLCKLQFGVNKCIVHNGP